MATTRLAQVGIGVSPYDTFQPKSTAAVVVWRLCTALDIETGRVMKIWIKVSDL